MNITYEKCGDYLVTNLILNSEPEGELRKFGLMRKFYGALFRVAVIGRIKGAFAHDTGTGGEKI